MASKIIATFAALIINAAAAVVIFFFMLLAMNGFHESDATWGLGAFIGLAILITLVMSIASVVIVHLLVKKRFSSAIAAIISILLCSVVGVVAQVISSIVGIMIADFVRRNY